MTPWFIATEPFTPKRGDAWEKYIEWSGLKQLEVASFTIRDVFANSELSPAGLVTDFGRAVEVRQRLRSMHPGERHADCHLWAIFRLG